MKFFSIKKDNKMSNLQIIDIIRNLVGEINNTKYKVTGKLEFDSIDKLVKSLLSNKQLIVKKNKQKNLKKAIKNYHLLNQIVKII